MMTPSDLAPGAAAGLLATAPMSLAMELMHALLPGWERYPLPPRLIMERLEESAEIRRHLNDRQEDALTLVGHFAYGAGAGAVYGPVSRTIPAPPALKGAAFGLSVWA